MSDPMDKQPCELDSAVVDVLAGLSDYDAAEVGARIRKLLDAKLHNEYFITKLLGAGIEHDQIDVREAIGLIPKLSKDSIGELVKVLELLEGRATDRVALTVDEAEELEQIRRGLGGVN